ncbi:MAG: putative dioxygenase [Propionibacteriaceae bacterium]|jgi:3-phenylpropionate/trans-cinnamate dioxygenase ferredoxin subunit|nr:putative dioxygenase [Propionibacteriaceae bacterium]MDF2747753.1 putative dioxygenase [Propionibacteriaceae bacterium]
MSALVRACSVDDVAPESAIPVEVPRNGSRLELAIVHSNGAFYAIADECSHASIPLSEGDVGDDEIECYLHGSRFDLRTGEPIGLPATEPVPIYRCLVEGNDVLVDVSAPIISGGDDPPDSPRSFVNISHTQEF